MRDSRTYENAVEPSPLAGCRAALSKAEEAVEAAEMMRAFRRLDPADRKHVLTLSRRLAAWHH